MTADDLSTPLGQQRKKPRRTFPITAAQGIVGALALFLGIFVLWATIGNDPFGGEPMVVVSADLHPVTPAKPAAGGRPAAVAAGGRVVGTSADLLWAVLTSAYAQLGFDVLGDDGFRAMVLARIVEPTSKAEVVRVLDEIGAPAVSLRTLFRSLARSRARDYRGQLAAAAWAHSVRTSGAAALVLYDVTTLHFERDDEDELRKAGMSKEHRVDPQVLAGLLADPAGFPLEVHPFEGNKAETTTLILVLSAFAQRHGVRDMVVVADAGMLSAANLNALEDAGFGFHRRLADHQGTLRPGRALRTARQLLHRRAGPGVGPADGHGQGGPGPAGGLPVEVQARAARQQGH